MADWVVCHSLYLSSARTRRMDYFTWTCSRPRCIVAPGASGRNGAGIRPATGFSTRPYCETRRPTSRHRPLLLRRDRKHPRMRMGMMTSPRWRQKPDSKPAEVAENHAVKVKRYRLTYYCCWLRLAGSGHATVWCLSVPWRQKTLYTEKPGRLSVARG